jgi:hypothetical protein
MDEFMPVSESIETPAEPVEQTTSVETTDFTGPDLLEDQGIDVSDN